MFHQTLPALPLSPVTYALPQSGTATSFFMPKLAEQGFGVPVRRIDGDYWPALQRRMNALLGHSRFPKHLMPNQLALLRLIRQETNPRVANLVTQRDLVRSDFETDPQTCEALLSALVLKELMAVDSLGLDFADGRRVPVDQNDLHYFRLLYALEHMGAIDGIVYDYDVFRAAQSPQHEDSRRIVLSAFWVFLAPKAVGMTELEILQTLDYGQRFDADAGPLHDAFSEAFRTGDARKAKGLRRQASGFVTQFPPGRTHPVASRTIVEVI